MRKADRIILTLFYLYVAMLPFENFMDELFGIKSPFRPHRILCLIIGLLILISRRFGSVGFNKNDLKLAGVYLFGLIPSLVAYLNNKLYIEYFWLTSIQYWIVLWLLLLIKNIPFTWREIHKALFIYSFGTVINAILMIIWFFYIQAGREKGLMDNPNFAAFSCNIALIYFFYNFVRSQDHISNFRRMLCGIASLILILGLLVTGSRSAIIATMLLIPFILFYKNSVYHKMRNAIVLTGLIVILGVSGMYDKLPAWNRLTVLFGKEDSRIVLWKQGFEAYKGSCFLGLGIEQFKNPMNYTKYVKTSDNVSVINQKGLVVHNDFLTVLYEYGPVSFVLFLSFYFCIFKLLIKKSDQIKDDLIYYGLYFNMVWYSLFTSSFQSHSMWFMYIILGLVAYLQNADIKDSDSNDSFRIDGYPGTN